MSKLSGVFLPVAFTLLLILQFFDVSVAQDISAKITMTGAEAELAVAGRFSDEVTPSGPRNMSFLTEYAGISGLGERITDLKLTGKSGTEVGAKRFVPGEYVAADGFERWSYRVNCEPLKNAASAAHVSWISSSFGVLMLDDILPQLGSLHRPVTARVEFEVPAGWHVVTVAKPLGATAYEVPDVEKAVFYLRKGGPVESVREDRFTLLINGEFQFGESDANQVAAEIIENYTKLFRSSPSSPSLIVLTRFPQTVSAGNWEADTRGGSVTIASSDMPFKTQSLQRLHEQLRHELFHLWIPNDLDLSGNYDWFYEGFALYKSLKTGVLSGRIRFDDFLDTLSRAYNIDDLQPAGLSLIDASTQRWKGNNTRIYSRGMIVAFLCDLTLLENSKGKRSIDNVLLDLYSKHRKPSKAMDGNSAILAILSEDPGLSLIVGKYIKGTEKVDWTQLLLGAGIESRVENQVKALHVVAKPNGRQKDLLDRLGYNVWRNIPRSSK